MNIKKIEEVEWNKKISSIKNKWVNRILHNLAPIVVIDNILYFKYIGEEDNKEKVFEAYKTHKLDIESELRELFQISSIMPGKNINEVKLHWLESLVSTFQPKEIKFKLF